MINIQQEMRKYSALLPETRSMPPIERLLALSPEKDVMAILPSIEIHADGLALSAVVLVTDNYIIDVRYGTMEVDADFISRTSIYNYRIRLWVHEIKSGEEVRARYDMAQIGLLHSYSTRGLATQFSYAGNQRDEWIRAVTEALPIIAIRGR